jgi:hypothetical protein
MIASECGTDGPNIGCEVNENGCQRSELYDSHRRGDLLCIAVVDIRPSAGEDEMCGRADGDELGQTLNNP